VKLGFNENQSKELLEFLINKKVLISEITIPPGIENPLSELINKLSSLPLKNSTKKEQWLIILEKIESLRQCFEKGTLTTRIQTLNEMQLLLSNAGIDLSRDQGKMYVGRFPVYEDCGRNLYLELGGSLVQELYDQMEILMPLYTWLAGAIAVKLHDRYLDCWHGLVKDISSINDEVDFISFLSTIQANDYTEQVINEIRNLLYKCWMQVGEGSDNLEEISLSANDLVNILKFLRQEEPRADRFPCFNINVHSPDFMLSASDKQSILEGNYSIVIGEIHPAVHTVSQPVAQPFCPYKQEVRAEVEEILSPNTLIVADSPNTYQRSHIDWLDVPQLMQVVLPDSVGRVPESRCLPAGNGRVKLKNGVLTYVDQLMKVEQDILTVIPSEMHRACFELASDVIGSSLSPRIILGRMILKRRSWNIVEESLGALSQPSEDLHSYLYWRQWAKSRDMPRFVFVKLEGEPKPVYIDFCNPLSIDILANFSKRKEPMKFSEMRPAPNELWLSDSRGDYCSEFRTSWRGSKVE
jgi:Lantibiotic dehydratase, N terminus